MVDNAEVGDDEDEIVEEAGVEVQEDTVDDGEPMIIDWKLKDQKDMKAELDQ